jgi:hypothetical protein
MNKLLSLIFVIGISIVSVAAAQAGGCGVHRGLYYGCTPVYGVHSGYNGGYYRGYRRGYYRGYRVGHYGGHYLHHRHIRYPYVRYDSGDVIAVDKGFCGFGSYLACTQGTCWRFCY